MALTHDEMEHKAQLEDAIEEITSVAKGLNLDFLPMIYEIVPSEALYTFGAYGMPTRFAHWSFGKAYHKMKMNYDHGLGRIYELVINSDPCYAFLLNGNSLLQNKLIVAHVLGHSDFFKNNYLFRRTRRDMIESMASFASRVSKYEQEHGQARVEKFLDAVLALSWHTAERNPKADRKPTNIRKATDPIPTKWDDLIQIGQVTPIEVKAVVEVKKYPEQPYDDLLLFFLENSRELEDWQRDILTHIREEALYFYPQMETKLMNEGWASFWHATIMRELDLTPDEVIDYAKMHAGVLLPNRYSVNPYYVGYHMMHDIEDRWNSPLKDEWGRVIPSTMTGRDKIFEVRATETDVSFVRNYLTPELCEKLDLYTYGKEDSHSHTDYTVQSNDYERVRDYWCWQLSNKVPKISLVDAAYSGSGILLHHHHDGIDLEERYTGNTLPYISMLWGNRKVFLETMREGVRVMYNYNPANNQVVVSRV